MRELMQIAAVMAFVIGLALLSIGKQKPGATALLIMLVIVAAPMSGSPF